MSYFIVFAGKGGTGKSTLASLTVKFLTERKLGPVLVVDADPNYCLPELLGVNVKQTVASVRDSALQNKPDGISLDEWLEIQINRIVEESEGFDLLVMGRPEGSGCYCAVNNVLKRILQEIAEQYRYIVVDNEAGMEHISRGIVNKIDLLFVVSTSAKSSIQAALRINELIKELNISPKKRVLVINMAFREFEDSEEQELLKNFDTIYYVFFDRDFLKLSEKGRNVFSLPKGEAIWLNFEWILEETIEQKI
ncbi:CO dehydrogenase maturation factor [Thermodesulfovibrio aggregans]|uniref:CO dehydrogenase maturation factor n=1 Tax=Thermodesulfovibrio aggregans TaxID=86166 RepID=A0A0U9HMW6_9BACT|nr:AAA family ATPase [Thermodesulfovibrio aggregans]GAQ94212.1 CO dehydrogenase maturation factor [Thermodesulfovibrio aggregans]